MDSLVVIVVAMGSYHRHLNPPNLLVGVNETCPGLSRKNERSTAAAAAVAGGGGYVTGGAERFHIIIKMTKTV